MADDDSFDCFLSHNSLDRQTADRLATILRDRKLRAWIDRDELAPGKPWLDGLAQGLHACRSVAVLVGPQGAGPWQTEETRTAVDLAVRGKLRVFAVLLPGAGDAPEIPEFLGNRNWVDLRQGLEDPAGLERLVWGITGVRPGRNGADASAPEPRTNATLASTPADPPTLTLLLGCSGDQISVSDGHPQPALPRTANLARLRRRLLTPDQDLVFRTLFGSPSRLADLVTAAGGAPADDPTRRPLRLRLLCTDPRIGALPWHNLHYQGERLGDKPGWIIEVTERTAGDTLTIALARPLIVGSADPASSISARSHVTLVKAHLARLLEAPRTPVPWAKTERELDEALGDRPGLIYVFAELHADGSLILREDAARPQYYRLERLVERLAALQLQPPRTKPILWLHLVEGRAAVDLNDLWVRLRPLTQLLLIQLTNPRLVLSSLGHTLNLMTRMAEGSAEPAAVVSRLADPDPAGTHLWLNGHGIRLRPGGAEAWIIAYIHASLLRLLLGRVNEKDLVVGGIHRARAGSLTFYGVCGDAQACVHDFPEQVRRYVEVYYRGITVETRPFPLTMSPGTRVCDEIADRFNQDLSVSQLRSLRQALEGMPVVPPDAKDTVVIALSWLLEPAPGFPPAQLAGWLAQWKQGLLEVLGQAQIPKPFRILIGACIQWAEDWPGTDGSDPRDLQRSIDQTLEQTERKGYVHCIKMLSPLDRLDASDLQALYRDEALRDRLHVGDLAIAEGEQDPIDVLAGYVLETAEGRFQDTANLIYSEYQCGYSGLQDALKTTGAAHYAKIAGAAAADPGTP